MWLFFLLATRGSRIDRLARDQGAMDTETETGTVIYENIVNLQVLKQQWMQQFFKLVK